MLYGANVWDPALIVAQIVAVQCLFYIVLGALQALIIGPRFGHLTIAYIFNHQTMQLGNQIGQLVALTHAVNSLAAATHLMWIVERAKKCLDFASTCYIWHLVFCWLYAGWPTSLTWWAVNSGGFIVMALAGEWLCVRRELQDIPLTTRGLGAGRKQSGMPMMPLPTEDPDGLPPRPRLRAAAATQRPAAAAAAAGSGGGGGTAAGGGGSGGGGGGGGGGAVQLAAMGTGSGGGAGGGGVAGPGSLAAGGGSGRESGGGAAGRDRGTISAPAARPPKTLPRVGSTSNVAAPTGQDAV